MATHSNDLFFSYFPNQIPIFDGDHYDYWSYRLEIIFLSQDLWKIVKEGYEERSTIEDDSICEEEEKENKDNSMKNKMILRILQQSVSKTIKSQEGERGLERIEEGVTRLG